MTRHGPLTAQGLGRSPYDEVFPGTGEANPQNPAQQYDERGRPVNPETRRINRDVIRSHNEVMQVIGVAEPDNNTQQIELENSTRRHHVLEDNIGNHLLKTGFIVQGTAAWIWNAFRLRNVICTRYQSVQLVDFFSYERTQRSLYTNIYAGYPAFIAVFYSWVKVPFADLTGRSIWYTFASRWIQLHLTTYGFLQQMDVVPASQLLPNWRFFIPFTSGSLIPAPPPPTDCTALEVLKYAGRLALSAAPLVTLAFCQQVWIRTRRAIRVAIRERLPQPTSNNKPGRPSLPYRTATVPPPPEEITNTNEPEPASEVLQELVHGSEETTADIDSHPEDPVRRPSIISTSNGTTAVTTDEPAAEVYPSDDEDNTGADLMSRTLISFDVEASDTLDPPPGGWSAELRANVTDSQQQPEQPEPSLDRTRTYRLNTLTQLPAMLAGEMLSFLLAELISAPSEAMVYRWVLRSFMESRGMSTEGVYGVFELLPGRAIENAICLELIHLLLQGEIWAVFYQIASCCRITEEVWKEMDAEDEEERLENEANAGVGE